MPIYVGTDANDRLTGSNGSDSIAGLDGDDTIDDGGPGAPDELVGGRGNDIYTVRNPGHTIVEYADEGFDEVRAIGYPPTSRYSLIPEQAHSVASGMRGTTVSSAEQVPILSSGLTDATISLLGQALQTR
jgi:RTX calcium-binding nonapeptide repeat (4 copies)